MSSNLDERVEKLEDTYWVVYKCKSVDDPELETNRIYYRIPGKFLYKEEAKKEFERLYEKDAISSCKGKFSEYGFIKIITDEEKNHLVQI